VIKDNKGYILEILRNDDALFSIGQVYLSTGNQGIVKGWHYHKIQTDYFTGVKGNAKVVLYNMREKSKTKGQIKELLISENNPVLIKIPSMIVHAITTLDGNPVYLINCPTKLYNNKNPDKYRLPLNADAIKYIW